MHGLKTCDVIIANKVASGRTTSSPGVTAPPIDGCLGDVFEALLTCMNRPLLSTVRLPSEARSTFSSPGRIAGPTFPTGTAAGSDLWPYTPCFKGQWSSTAGVADTDMHKMARQGTHAKTRRSHRVQVVEATKMVSISPYNHQLGFFGMK